MSSIPHYKVTFEEPDGETYHLNIRQHVLAEELEAHMVCYPSDKVLKIQKVVYVIRFEDKTTEGLMKTYSHEPEEVKVWEFASFKEAEEAIKEHRNLYPHVTYTVTRKDAI